MYYVVKQIMLVTRFHLVVGDSQPPIEAVKEVADNTEYLDSCDELHWDDNITYSVEDLGDDLGKDLRLKNTARHIDERLSKKTQESTLTPGGLSPIVKGRKKKKKEFDVLSLVEGLDE